MSFKYRSNAIAKGRILWDGSPKAGKPLYLNGGKETHTEMGVNSTRSRTLESATSTTSECPRGARMALKDCSDNEAVRSRGQDLVSTINMIFFVYLDHRFALRIIFLKLCVSVI